MGQTLKKIFQIIFISFTVFSYTSILVAQEDQSLEGKNIIDFFLDTGYFLDNDDQYFVETYISINELSLLENPNKEKNIDVSIKVKSLSNQSIVDSFQSELNLDNNSSTKNYHFITFMLPFQLEPDSFQISVDIKDLNVPNSSTTTIIKELVLPRRVQNSFMFSDIVFIDQIKPTEKKNIFSKHGYDIIPKVTNSFYYNADSLMFYLEAYNLEKEINEAYFVRCYITEANSTQRKAKYTKTFKPNKPKDFIVTSTFINIKDLPSQTYVIHVEYLKNDGTMINSTHKKFYVYNSNISNENTSNTTTQEEWYSDIFGYSENELDYFIPTLGYISSNIEVNFAKSLTNFEEKKNYFLNFWQKRHHQKPEIKKAWNDYLNKIKYANQRFKASHNDGWRTDRGRVLLTYGLPNDIQSFPVEHDKVPYEIWTYNQLKGQSGVIFVFYDRDLVTDNYQLLHSSLLNEVNNSTWRENLMKRRDRNFNFENSNQDYTNFKDNIPRTTGTPR